MVTDLESQEAYKQVVWQLNTL